MTTDLTVLCAAKLHKNQLERHLELFEHIAEVKKVIVVRHAPAGEGFSKVQNRCFRPGSVPGQALRMGQTIRSVLVQERVDLVVGFNPVPWGSVATTAGRSCGVPVCMSLIGKDFLQVQKWWGRPFLEAIRRAQVVTVTGRSMVSGLIDLGVEAERIHVLAHSVDTRRFSPKNFERKFDVISVGQLIERKRMDRLIEAIAILAEEGRRLRLAILGKGPLRESLEALATRRGIGDLVTFFEYRNDVETLLRQAPVFCLASEWEGVPFALMEAMSVGLVPVVTDVGTIADWVQHGNNGFLVHSGDAVALAGRLRDLFENDEGELTRLRHTVLEERNRLSFLEGARTWRKILGLNDAALKNFPSQL